MLCSDSWKMSGERGHGTHFGQRNGNLNLVFNAYNPMLVVISNFVTFYLKFSFEVIQYNANVISRDRSLK